MNKWILTGAVVALAACGGSSGPASPLEPSVTVVGDTTFLELPVGTAAMVGAVSIHMDGVTEDSRCPYVVACVWEGNASIELTVSDGIDTEVLGLSTNIGPQQQDFGGLTIRFDDLYPYPGGYPTDPDRYRAKLAVYP